MSGPRTHPIDDSKGIGKILLDAKAICIARLRRLETGGDIIGNIKGNEEKIKEKRQTYYRNKLARIESELTGASHSRAWYQEFESTIVLEDLKKYRTGLVDDGDVRKDFIKHAKAIVAHHKEEKKVIGNVEEYLVGIELADKELARLSNSTFGYASLVSLVGTYIANKLRGKHTEIPGQLGEALRIIGLHNEPESTGKIPLTQVTCMAERDFSLLLMRYVQIFLLSGNQFQFKQRSINFALKIPFLDKVVLEKLGKYENSVQTYEASQTISASAAATASVTHQQPSVTQNVGSKMINDLESKIMPRAEVFLDIDKEVSIRSYSRSLYSPVKMSMRSYLLEMTTTDPEKAKAIWKAISDNNHDALLLALSHNRNRVNQFIDRFFESTGRQIYQYALTPKSVHISHVQQIPEAPIRNKL